MIQITITFQSIVYCSGIKMFEEKHQEVLNVCRLHGGATAVKIDKLLSCLNVIICHLNGYPF